MRGTMRWTATMDVMVPAGAAAVATAAPHALVPAMATVMVTAEAHAAAAAMVTVPAHAPTPALTALRDDSGVRSSGIVKLKTQNYKVVAAGVAALAPAAVAVKTAAMADAWATATAAAAVPALDNQCRGLEFGDRK